VRLVVAGFGTVQQRRTRRGVDSDPDGGVEADGAGTGDAG